MRWDEITEDEMERYRQAELADDEDEEEEEKGATRSGNIRIQGKITAVQPDKRRNGVIITINGKQYHVPQGRVKYVPSNGTEVVIVSNDSEVRYIQCVAPAQEVVANGQDATAQLDTALNESIAMIRRYKKDLDELKIDPSQLICTLCGTIAIERLRARSFQVEK